MSDKKKKKTGKDAKEKLLQAAIKIFAIHGFEGASTRLLTKEAGVNISAIPYYFESKEGLYEAVVRHIISQASEKVGEMIQHIKAALEESTLTQPSAREFLHQFIKSMTIFLLSEQNTPYFAQIIVREQMQPSSIFEILYDDFMGPVHAILTRLISFLCGTGAHEVETILCTHSILGQLMVFKTHQELALRSLGVASLSAENVETIIQLILQNTDAVIAAHRRRDE
ncbi:MAG: CerR family C-terminal domain-containing protein [Methylocystaceae bacterium]|nr:CerR family C-terminal domain-containing protein [Methylocystaceae bacterium]